MVTVGILALQGDVAEHVRALEESGARAVLVRGQSELEAVESASVFRPLRSAIEENRGWDARLRDLRGNDHARYAYP